MQETIGTLELTHRVEVLQLRVQLVQTQRQLVQVQDILLGNQVSDLVTSLEQAQAALKDSGVQ